MDKGQSVYMWISISSKNKGQMYGREYMSRILFTKFIKCSQQAGEVSSVLILHMLELRVRQGK